MYEAIRFEDAPFNNILNVLPESPSRNLCTKVWPRQGASRGLAFRGADSSEIARRTRSLCSVAPASISD
jgi:hypothetical protein